jgi:hypothetical protein
MIPTNDLGPEPGPNEDEKPRNEDCLFRVAMLPRWLVPGFVHHLLHHIRLAPCQVAGEAARERRYSSE